MEYILPVILLASVSLLCGVISILTCFIPLVWKFSFRCGWVAVATGCLATFLLWYHGEDYLIPVGCLTVLPGLLGTYLAWVFGGEYKRREEAVREPTSTKRKTKAKSRNW